MKIDNILVIIMCSLVVLLIILVTLAMIGRNIQKRDIENNWDEKEKTTPILKTSNTEKSKPEAKNSRKQVPSNPPSEVIASKEKKERVPFYMAPGFESSESGTDLINGIPW